MDSAVEPTQSQKFLILVFALHLGNHGIAHWINCSCFLKNQYDVYGYIRVYMGKYGYIWVCMSIYGYIWVYVGNE